VTFTPRLILADLKGSLGTLPEHGGLYEEAQVLDPSNVDWSKPADVVKKEAPPSNEFLADLEKTQNVGKYNIGL
jgi:hypothetical protein